MSALKSDRQGFLIGEPLNQADATRLLSEIKSDTGRMLAAMMGVASAGAERRRRAAANQSRMASAASMARPGMVNRAAVKPVAAAAQQMMRGPQPRDERGRFLSYAAAAPTARAAQPVPAHRVAEHLAAVAQATKQAAATQEKALKGQQEIERRRRANGQFGEGGGKKAGDPDDKPMSRLDRFREALRNGARGAGNGAGEIDPEFQAAAEIKNGIGRIKDVVAPLFARAPKAAAPKAASPLKRVAARVTGLLGRKTAAPAATAAGAGASGGGILGGIMTVLTGGLGSLVPLATGVAAAAGGVATAFGTVLKKLPLLGAAIELVTGWKTFDEIDKNDKLTPDQKTDAKWQAGAEVAGRAGGAALGAAGGMALGALTGPLAPIAVPALGAAGAWLGSKAGGAAGDLAGRAANSDTGKAVRKTVASAVDAGLGWVSAKFESGGRGAGTVSTGKGDLGGASYGTHQLASKTGTLQKFLASTGYGDQFAGMTPGTPVFNAKWKEIAASDPSFAKAQHDFITTTHYEPQMAKLAAAGMDLSGKGKAVQEAVYSTATQFGAKTSLIQSALKGKDVAGMSDADIVSAIQNYKTANNDSLFRSSSAAVREGTLRRATAEKGVLLGQANMPTMPVAGAGGAAMAPIVPSIPGAPAVPTAVAPAMPSAPSSMGGGGERPAQAAVRQDVSDRNIAHIVTGGIAQPNFF